MRWLAALLLLAGAMHRAYTAAGGNARLVELGPFRQDGHSLFLGTGGVQLWGPVLAGFLR